MYCLNVSKEQKEAFQVSFYLYCTLTEINKLKNKTKNNNSNFNLQYTLPSKKANILKKYHQLKSFLPLIKLHSAHFISCVLKYTGKCFKRQLTHSTNNVYENAEILFQP